MDAYKVKSFQIAGLPAWGNSQSYMYDLEAKAEGEGPPTVDKVRLMLQAFLADRFQLRIHQESRLLPVYALVPAKKGVRLIPSKAPCLARPGFFFDMYTGDGVSIFTAVEEKWGMKLESENAPVDVMVVDRVERPSEN